MILVASGRLFTVKAKYPNGNVLGFALLLNKCLVRVALFTTLPVIAVNDGQKPRIVDQTSKDLQQKHAIGPTADGKQRLGTQRQTRGPCSFDLLQ
jgi:hypothetical protein